MMICDVTGGRSGYCNYGLDSINMDDKGNKIFKDSISIFLWLRT